MDLILVRHGLAWERDAEHWPDDSQRPLRPQGIRRFRAESRGIAHLVPHVDALWTSPYVRALQTATILHEEARWPKPIAEAALGEGALLPHVFRLLARVTNPTTLAIVGHAPDLDRLATLAILGRQTPALICLKKGGMACVRFEAAVRRGAGTLLWMAPPRLLRMLDD